MVCLLAVPALTDYTGDHSLTVYEHNTINGGVVFDTVEDGSKYTLLYSPPQNMTKPVLSQDLTVAIPAGATVRTARLYNYYTWSKSDYGDKYTPGDPAEANLTFNEVLVTCQNPDPITNTIDYGNGVHVGAQAEQVNGYDRPRPISNLLSHQVRVHIVGRPVHIDEHRLRPAIHDRIGRGNPCERRDDYLVARTDAHSRQDQVQSGSAVAAGQCVPDLVSSGERLFEIGDFRPLYDPTSL